MKLLNLRKRIRLDNKKNNKRVGLINNLEKYSQHQNLSENKRVVFDSFIEKGFPTTRNEEWKYTSLKKVVKSEYNLILNTQKSKIL